MAMDFAIFLYIRETVRPRKELKWTFLADCRNVAGVVLYMHA